MTDAIKKSATILDMDALLDLEMGKVETLPDYIDPPAGLYELEVVSAKFEKYEDTKAAAGEPKDRVRIRMVNKVVKTIAVAEGQSPVPDESLFSQSFQGTEDGVKFFKKAAMGVMGATEEEMATVKLKDVMEGLTGVPYRARITIRTSKGQGENAGKTYENINVRAVPADAAS